MPASSVKFSISIVLLLILCGCQSYRYFQTPSQALLKTETVVLPSRFSCGAIFVKAAIGDDIPRWFFFDTGSAVIALSEKFYPASAMNEAAFTMQLVDVTGESESRPVVLLNDISIGDASLDHVSAVVVSDSGMSAIDDVLGEEVAGIIGINAFTDFTIKVDYEQEVVALSHDPVGSENGSDILRFRSVQHRPHINSRINNRRYSVLLDTGVTGRPHTGSLLRRITPSIVPGDLVVTPNGSYRQGMAKLDADISFGQYVFKQPLVSVDLESSNDRPEEFIIYGESVLRNFVSEFDMVNKRVKLESQTGASSFQPESWHTIGIGFEWLDGEWFVRDFVPGTLVQQTPISLGDKVHSLNGEPFDIKSFCEMERKNAPIVLGIERREGGDEAGSRSQQMDIQLPVTILIN